jgi:hypothetical protein
MEQLQPRLTASESALERASHINAPGLSLNAGYATLAFVAERQLAGHSR